MAVSINLLPDIGKKDRQQTKRLKQFYIVSIVLIAITAIAMLSAFGYRYLNTRQFNRLADQIKQVRSGINNYKKVESDLVNIHQKIDVFNNMTKSSIPAAGIFDYLEKITPQGVTYSSFQITEDTAVVLSAETATFEDVSAMIQNLNIKQQGLPIYDVTVTSLTKNSDTGLLDFGVTFSLTQSDEKQKTEEN